MALVRCPSCSQKISAAATSCPGCGEPRPEDGWSSGSRSRLDGFLVFVVIMMALGALGKISGGDESQEPKATREVAPKEAVSNSDWDGSVWQVERYLERNLKDPDSFEAIEWGKVVKTAQGYQVRCLYRAKNSFGGYVVENVLVEMDNSGGVTGYMKIQ